MRAPSSPKFPKSLSVGVIALGKVIERKHRLHNARDETASARRDAAFNHELAAREQDAIGSSAVRSASSILSCAPIAQAGGLDPSGQGRSTRRLRAASRRANARRYIQCKTAAEFGWMEGDGGQTAFHTSVQRYGAWFLVGAGAAASGEGPYEFELKSRQRERLLK